MSSSQNISADSLTIYRREGKIRAHLQTMNWSDDKTHTIYIPSLDISASAATAEEAHDIMMLNINDLFKSLLAVKPANMQDHLRENGWNRFQLPSRGGDKFHMNSDRFNLNIDNNSAITSDTKISFGEILIA